LRFHTPEAEANLRLCPGPTGAKIVKRKLGATDYYHERPVLERYRITEYNAGSARRNAAPTETTRTGGTKGEKSSRPLFGFENARVAVSSPARQLPSYWQLDTSDS